MASLKERQAFWDSQAGIWETHRVFGQNKGWFRSYVSDGLSQIREMIPENSIHLDLGAGANNGFYSWYRGKTISADISVEMLLNNRKGGVVLDAEKKFPFADNSFDLVTSFFMMRYVSSQIEVAKEIVRVLKPSGVFYIVDLYSNGYPMQRGHFLPHAIRNILRHNFEHIYVDSHDDGLKSTNSDFMLGSVYGSKDKEIKINWRERSWPKPEEVMPF